MMNIDYGVFVLNLIWTFVWVILYLWRTCQWRKQREEIYELRAETCGLIESFEADTKTIEELKCELEKAITERENMKQQRDECIEYSRSLKTLSSAANSLVRDLDKCELTDNVVLPVIASVCHIMKRCDIESVLAAEIDDGEFKKRFAFFPESLGPIRVKVNFNNGEKFLGLVSS